MNESFDKVFSRRFFLFIIFGIIVFSLLLFLGDFNQISKSLSSIRIEILVLIVIFTTVNISIRFLKWEYFLRKLGVRIPARTSLMVFLSGLSMIITPGKLGEAIKAQLLKQAKGVQRRKTLAVVFSERLTDAIGLAILSLIGLSAFLTYVYSLIFVFAFLFFIIFAITNEAFLSRFENLGEKLPKVGKYAKYLRGFFKHSKRLLNTKTLAVSTSVSIFSWFFECFALFILLQSLNYPISLLNSIFIFSFSSIFGSLLVLPGGLGAAEGSFVVLLVLAGIPTSIAVLSTIVIRIFTLFYGLVIGLISLYILNRNLRLKRL